MTWPVGLERLSLAKTGRSFIASQPPRPLGGDAPGKRAERFDLFAAGVQGRGGTSPGTDSNDDKDGDKRHA